MPGNVKKPTLEEIERAKRLLEAAGHVVKPPKPEYQHVGFQVEIGLLKRFRAAIDKRGVKTKDAINQAITEWLERYA